MYATRAPTFLDTQCLRACVHVPFETASQVYQGNIVTFDFERQYAKYNVGPEERNFPSSGRGERQN